MAHPGLRLGMFALAQLGTINQAWAVLATDDRQPRFLWWPAAWTTTHFAATELVPLLLHYAGSNDPYFRVMGTRGLARLPRERSEGAIVQLLEDTNEKVRIEAVRAAGRLKLRQTVPRLLQLMAGDTDYVKLEAVRALASLPDPRALDPLIDQLSDPSPWIRAAALRAVAFQDRDSFWLLLAGMDGDPQWSVRAALARVLGEIGGARAIALLQQMASERDFRVRPHALRALVQASPSQAFPIMIDHLKVEDPFERAAAAEGLRTLRQDGGVTPLRAAMEASLRDTAPDAGLGILAALEAYGDEAVRPAAQIALDHKSWPVRKRAAAILRTLGDPVAPVAGPTTDRTVSDHLSLLTATYTPHAFIRTTQGNIEVELFIVDAPVTVGNFMKLAREGFYNGLSIDRVVPNFLIQGGDPRGDNHGGPG